MNTIKTDFETGWVMIPGETKTVVAHFKDVHKETMKLYELLTSGKRKKNNIVQIDCYAENEEIK